MGINQAICVVYFCFMHLCKCYLLIDKFTVNRISIKPLTYKLDAITVKSQEITPYELLQSSLYKLKTNCLNENTFISI